MIAPNIVLGCFAFLFGAVVGSFLNVCIFRIPKSESVVFPPSHCNRCDYLIRWYDNIPILSYLALHGKCRRCGAPISLQYPLVEFINGALTLALFLRFGPSLAFAVLFLFCSALVVVTFIDLEHQIIPDSITLPGIVVGFIASFFFPGHGWLNSLIGMVAGGGSLLLIAYGYQAIAKKDGMGGGDIKLLAAASLWAGPDFIAPFLFITAVAGGLLGATIAGVTFLRDRKQENKIPLAKIPLPYGIAIAVGGICLLLLLSHSARIAFKV